MDIVEPFSLGIYIFKASFDLQRWKVSDFFDKKQIRH